ncbi:VanZ family protein [Streptomyces sp. ST2-7A]|uniref:VanZ family protein n=1 Tax=Streptomyces sp. ST2-7A TaxID=2907214 RepID=UPI001F1727DC|nr:VanZ family protein [Streptomyces sp. ST2-7A]MCE7081825.1 VanZ family protein [Streptomyces sp. ST2-7A]
MLSAIFGGEEGFLVLLALPGLVTLAGTHLLLRRRAARPLMWALWASCAVGILAVTLWSSGPVGGTGVCVVNRSLTEPFSDTQGRMNIAMFVPVGLFGTLATRRPGLVLISGVLFSAGIETAQAVLPFVARICETGDLIANATGLAIGTAAGTVVTLLRRRPASPSVLRARHVTIGALGTAAVLAGVWVVGITPWVLDRVNHHVPALPADHEQRAAISEELTGAFGDPGPAGEGNEELEAEFSPDTPGTGRITARFGTGLAELSWPDRDRLTVFLVPFDPGFDPADPEAVHGFPVPGAEGPVSTAGEAIAVAVAYAERFHPGLVRGVEPTADPVGADAGSGWLVRWRHHTEDGLLLPTRLDLRIEPSGVLADLWLDRTTVPDPPPVRLTEIEAWEVLDKHLSPRVEDADTADAVLVAERPEDNPDGDEWRAHWLLLMTVGDETIHGVVDAGTGAPVRVDRFSSSPHAPDPADLLTPAAP